MTESERDIPDGREDDSPSDIESPEREDRTLRVAEKEKADGDPALETKSGVDMKSTGDADDKHDEKDDRPPVPDVTMPDVPPDDFIAELEVYKGPLALLLYLIRENEVDLYDIPIATILDQYMVHLKIIENLNLNAAGEFLVMASKLLEIKSRMLLPIQREEDAVDLEEIEDPRDELVQQLIQYQEMKRAAHILNLREEEWKRRYGRDPKVYPRADPNAEEEIEADLFQLLQAFDRVVRQTLSRQPARVGFDGVTVEEKVELITDAIIQHKRLSFIQLFTEATDRWDVAATFLAILELCRLGQIRILQSGDYEEIFIEHREGDDDLPAEPIEVQQDAPPPKAPRFEGVQEEADLDFVDSEDIRLEDRVREIESRANEIIEAVSATRSGGGTGENSDAAGGENPNPTDSGSRSDAGSAESSSLPESTAGESPVSQEPSESPAEHPLGSESSLSRIEEDREDGEGNAETLSDRSDIEKPGDPSTDPVD